MGDIKQLVVIRRRHIDDHGSAETFVNDVKEWTANGSIFMIVLDDWGILINRTGEK